eukprot:COSAG02_NODE_9939_length_2070_cov_1.429731_4_plen_53_part_01
MKDDYNAFAAVSDSGSGSSCVIGSSDSDEAPLRSEDAPCPVPRTRALTPSRAT